MIQVKQFEEKFGEAVIHLIINIQQNEFGVPITINDQKDLLNIEGFYQKGKGNFWIALMDKILVGTIALIDIGNGEACLRKMFVEKYSRGKEFRVAMLLLNTLLHWARQNEISAIYLGTTDVLKASHRFYEKNGFVLLPKERLPETFPVMVVDTRFYVYYLK